MTFKLFLTADLQILKKTLRTNIDLPVIIHYWVGYPFQDRSYYAVMSVINELDFLEANLQYTHIRYVNGRESIVSVRDFALISSASQTDFVAKDGNFTAFADKVALDALATKELLKS